MRRRIFLTAGAAFAATPALLFAHEGAHPFSRSEEEWRAMLKDEEFKVMRRMGTEPSFSSPLNEIIDKGMFHCKGCDQALYSSGTKFESGTGWPSFWEPVEGAVGTKPDRGFFTTRTEVHCARCGSHMGHVFDDGPEPTGKRHCINGIAMVFRPAGGGAPVTG